MIFVDAGNRTRRSLDARLLLAEQLRQAGFDAGIDADTLPADLHRNHKYDCAMLAAEPRDTAFQGAILIGAEHVSDAPLSTLRGYAPGPDQPVVALGRFESRQARIGARSRIAYAIGAEPWMLDLDEIQPAPILALSLIPL